MIFNYFLYYKNLLYLLVIIIKPYPSVFISFNRWNHSYYKS